VLNKLPKQKSALWEEFYVKLLMVMQASGSRAAMLIVRYLWLADEIDRSRFASADRAMKEAFRRAGPVSSD
jgi:hypothetical protein